MNAQWRLCGAKTRQVWVCVMLVTAWISSLESSAVHWPTKYDYTTIADLKICERG